MLTDHRLDQLVADLASADPAVRDDGAYAELARAVGDEELTPAQCSRLGARMVERLHHPEPQARSFAPLVLALLASHGVVEPAWVTAVHDWYTTEPDLRGYDPELGWVHAAAHGADCVAEFGLAHAAEPFTLLATLVQRLVAPTDHVFRDQEDDRIAYAMAMLLTDDRLASESVDGWLAPVADLLGQGASGAVPPPVSNTLRTPALPQRPARRAPPRRRRTGGGPAGRGPALGDRDHATTRHPVDVCVTPACWS